MKKKILKIDPDINFSLFGVACHLKDYRFVWTLNNILKTDYHKTKSFILKGFNTDFSSYHYQSEHDHSYVFSNKSEKGFLINKKKNVDYWLLLNSGYDVEIQQKHIMLINRSEHILTVFEENDKKIKEQFLF